MKAQHIHQYKLRKLGKDKSYIIYKCVLPNCPHYVPIELAIDKLTLCWVCKEPTKITGEHVGKKVVKPKCLDCLKKSERSLKMRKENASGVEDLVNLFLKD